jgi:glutamate synthase (NADPH/NADH) small chain
MKNKKVPVREQNPKERIKNFSEVCLGYNEDEAVQEAQRCLECGKCIPGCPAEINIPKFIHLVKEKKFIEAVKVIKETNSLPGICGRVCPQEKQCEALCPLGIKGEPVAIGKLERFVADYEREKKEIDVPVIKPNHIKVAVIGSGSAGLTCAGELAKNGFDVTVFESLHQSGGVLRYGIPEFRLPREVLDTEIDYIRKLGVKILNNVLVGKSITIDDLKKEGFKAIFIGTGAGLPSFMNIPGENLNGIFSANEFLTRNNLMQAYKFPYGSDTPIKVESPVIVVGGGNVAIDSARVAKRLGAEKVVILYRRTETEMPARVEEIIHAKEEEIEFHFLTLPKEFVGNEKGWVEKTKCVKMKLGEPDSSGRRKPIPIENSEFFIESKTVIIAIGQNPNPLLLQTTPQLKITEKQTVWVDENLMTSIPGVFAGGDIISGAATVIEAIGAGRKAALSIMSWLKR